MVETQVYNKQTSINSFFCHSFKIIPFFVLPFKKLYFKEHGKLDVFGSGDGSPFELPNLFRLKLLSVSNLYGFAAVAYKNSKKNIVIMNIHLSQFYWSFIISQSHQAYKHKSARGQCWEQQCWVRGPNKFASDVPGGSYSTQLSRNKSDSDRLQENREHGQLWIHAERVWFGDYFFWLKKIFTG